MSASLSQNVRIAKELADRIRTSDTDEEEQLLADMIEGETDLNECLAKIVLRISETTALADGLDGIISGFRARQVRFTRRVERLRSYILWAMGEVGIKKLELPVATLSLSQSSKGRVEVFDADRLPRKCVSYVAKPNLEAIRLHLEEGEEVPGACLSNSPPSLTIRTK